MRWLPASLEFPSNWSNKINLTLTSAGGLENGLLVLLTFADVDDGDLVRLATSLRVLETNSEFQNFGTTVKFSRPQLHGETISSLGGSIAQR